MNNTNVNRIIAHKRRMTILTLLELEPLDTTGISDAINESFPVVSEDLCRLYKRGFVSRVKKLNEKKNREFWSYSTIHKNMPLPNIKLTTEQWQYVNNFVNYKKSDFKVTEIEESIYDGNGRKRVVTNPNNPNCKTYFNLNRSGSDYSWQRPKRKHTTVNIGSTFALYDGATL
ncbi:hypothetical protein UFOVP17_13 [uncultured Caudovirales phage]|uniref:Uncharacterized protein n=1 Tax=uncultured Caudovirales phage TaxID=2100421 RepID=A0A6J5KL33_9CAUD|nr:hypothetical protein UFOVP17_13 [uncultured Caudovirales phage]